jgi:hypothetical protein
MKAGPQGSNPNMDMRVIRIAPCLASDERRQGRRALRMRLHHESIA